MPIKLALKTTRPPITNEMLHCIQTILSKKTASFCNPTHWAMCCLAFFGFLRVSEFTIPKEGSYNSSRHLSLSDTAVNNREKPWLLQLSLKQSKTDSFKHGIKVFVGATDGMVCPIKVIFAYVEKANDQVHFITKEGIG